MNHILKATRNQKSPTHYNDGVVDFRIIPNRGDYTFDTMAVFVGKNGYAKAIDCESNFFAPIDLIRIYRKVLMYTLCEPETQRDYIEAFKAYLIRTGCKPEDLED